MQDYSDCREAPWHWYCTSITTLKIGKTVTHIGNNAFYGLPNLTKVTIENPEIAVGTNTFSNCAAAFTLHGWTGSPAETYATENGNPFVSIGIVGACGDNASFLFDASTGALTISGTGAMAYYDDDSDVPWDSQRASITSLVVEQGVTSIGERNFNDCAHLTSVTLPEGLLSIGLDGFANCPGLSGVTIPDSVTLIGSDAFMNCTGLTSVVIPAKVVHIGYKAFTGCAALTSATVLNPETRIGDKDYDVFKFTAASFVLRGWPGSVAETYAQAAGHTFEALPLLALPSALTAMEENAFQGVSALGVRIPKEATDISGDPFAGSGVQYIIGVSRSAAETFAANYGYSFIPVTK